MNVASLPLCKELDELSGWGGTAFMWAEKIRTSRAGTTYTYTDWSVRYSKPHKPTKTVPAYDLSYLMHRIACAVGLMRSLDLLEHAMVNDRNFEDGACFVAIELFKQGILTRDAS